MNQIPDPEVFVSIDYSGFPPYADHLGLNFFTCLQVNLVMEFHLSENAKLRSEMPATLQRVAL